MIGTTNPRPQRFLRAIPFVLVAAACGGGGGGGASGSKPVVVAASFVGSGPSPAAGDTLLLTFSEGVELIAGRLLTDADVALSGGGTLGAVAAAPTQASANTIVVTLGTGVTFTPGATTVTLLDPNGSNGNDVVRDATGQLGIAAAPVTIGTSDGADPTIGNVTIAAVDDELNGDGAAGGTLQVPASGWTIDLAYSDNTAIATAQTQITANVAVGTSAGSQPAGTNLLPFLTTLSANNTAASYSLPATTTFPNAPVTLTCIVVDISGRASAPATFTATVLAFNATRQPFETNVNASQVWFLDFTRDIESFTANTIAGGAEVAVNAGANGRSDFEDILRILGLNSATPIPAVQGALDSNQVVVERFQQALLAELAAFYDGANIAFTLTQPSGSFNGNSTLPYASIGFSRIAIAGSADTPGVLGVAVFDPNNETQDDDTDLDFGGTLRLGIFLHTIVDSGLGPPGASLFRLTYSQFAAVLSGTPIGNDVADDDRLTGALTDARATAIDTAIADFARFTAVVTAHECGHSMGLVQNGAMPVGLYGNDTTNFPGSSDGHIRNASLFPAGTNIMSPSLSYTGAVNAATAFNRLNLAYLREQVTYGN
jgi:hypothetical protein